MLVAAFVANKPLLVINSERRDGNKQSFSGDDQTAPPGHAKEERYENDLSLHTCRDPRAHVNCTAERAKFPVLSSPKSAGWSTVTAGQIAVVNNTF